MALRRPLTLANAVLCLSTWAAHASADAGAAEGLFRDGHAAMGRQDYAAACAAFAASQAAEPSVGALINLGQCNEKQNKIASAWGHYNAAASLAELNKQASRAQAARAEAERLTPKLQRIVVRVAGQPGAEITRDGTKVPEGASVPADPGPHVVLVRAPGKRPLQKTVVVTAGERPVYVVDVEGLEDAASQPVKASPPLATNPRAAETPSGGGRTAGWVLGAVGVAGVATAAGFFIFDAVVTAPGRDDIKGQRDDECAAQAGSNRCTSLQASYESKASASDTNRLIALGAGGGGLVALAVGGILLVTSGTGTSRASAVHVVPTFVGHGLGLRGTF